MPIRAIVAMNPHINPHNLRVGEVIFICPGYSDSDKESGTSSEYTVDKHIRELKLNNEMRQLATQHVFWTHYLLTSIVEKDSDVDAVRARLFRNPSDLARIAEQFYGRNVARRIEDLIAQHLILAEDMIESMAEGNKEAEENIDLQWYRNADQIARELVALNPYYDYEVLKKILYQNLDQIKQQAALQIAGNYPGAILNYDIMEENALQLADYLTEGIIKQFSY